MILIGDLKYEFSHFMKGNINCNDTEAFSKEDEIVFGRKRLLSFNPLHGHMGTFEAYWLSLREWKPSLLTLAQILLLNNWQLQRPLF